MEKESRIRIEFIHEMVRNFCEEAGIEYLFVTEDPSVDTAITWDSNSYNSKGIIKLINYYNKEVKVKDNVTD